MNEDVKQLWLTDLRSGEFKQGQGQLRTLDNKHCCLGVLCERYHRETGDGEWVRTLRITDKNTETWEFRVRDIDTFTKDERTFASEYVLPQKVKLWAGLSDTNPLVLVSNEEMNEFALTDNQVSLANLNDGAQTFVQIADVIEKSL